jgi:hypothetical protein
LGKAVGEETQPTIVETLSVIKSTLGVTETGLEEDPPALLPSTILGDLSVIKSILGTVAETGPEEDTDLEGGDTPPAPVPPTVLGTLKSISESVGADLSGTVIRALGTTGGETIMQALGEGGTIMSAIGTGGGKPVKKRLTALLDAVSGIDGNVDAIRTSVGENLSYNVGNATGNEALRIIGELKDAVENATGSEALRIIGELKDAVTAVEPLADVGTALTTIDGKIDEIISAVSQSEQP